MSITIKHLALPVIVLLLISGGSIGLAEDAENVTIVGTVMDGYQIVSEDGYPYEVEDTDKGNQLVLQYIGYRVEVTGTVKDQIDYKSIVVDSFRVIEDE